MACALEWETMGIARGFLHRYRASPFNPDNTCVRQLGLEDGFQVALSQFFSVHFQIFSVQAQADWTGRADYSPENGWRTGLTVNQFTLQKDFFQNLVVVVGRSIERWGTGYAFNPTDVAAPEKELSDPDNSEKRAKGKDMVKLEYFGETFSVALCYILPGDIGRPMDLRDSRLALRVYKNYDRVDLSFVSRFQRGETPVWGFNVAAVFGQRLEIHGEASIQKGTTTSYHPAILGEKNLYQQDPLRPLKQDDGKFYLQALLGFQVTLPGNTLWVSEYYHRGQGYSTKEWSRILDYVSFLNTSKEDAPEDLVAGNLLWSLQVFSPKGALQDYWMNHVQVPISRRWQLTATHFMNLADFSFVLIPEINTSPGTAFTFYVRSTIFQGRGRSEFGAFFQSFSLEAGMRVRL
jgi:hypothetical protein